MNGFHIKRFLCAVAAEVLLSGSLGLTPARAATVTIDGNIGLQSFVSLADAHMRVMLEDLQRFARTDAARSGNWSQIERPLRAATNGAIAAALIYGTREGRYWIAGKGLQSVRIADRPYFAKVLAGKSVVGDIVFGRATVKPVAIVAVPVYGRSGMVEGIVGAAVDLAALSNLLVKEMGVTNSAVFWAVDANGVTALHSDSTNVFNNALQNPELHSALRHMIDTPSGVQRYTFKGRLRTVLYRHSALTGWTYGFGALH